RRASIAILSLSAAAALADPAAGLADVMYVSNFASTTIEKFDTATGADLGVFASAGIGLSDPYGSLALDKAGNLYVGNYSSGTIGKFTPAGVGSVFASNPQSYPLSMASDSAG